MANPAYPLINGNRFDFASIKLEVGDQTIVGFKEIAYKEKLDYAWVYGNDRKPIGNTEGVYNAEGSLTLYKSEARELRNALKNAEGHGYGVTTFLIVVNYANNGEEVITDELVGCRAVEWDSTHAQGTDGLEEKITLAVHFLIRDGAQMVASPIELRG